MDQAKSGNAAWEMEVNINIPEDFFFFFFFCLGSYLTWFSLEVLFIVSWAPSGNSVERYELVSGIGI